MVKQHKPTVAIFGGSFDPPHRGHQDIVGCAINSLDIDKLVLLPAYLNPFKSSTLILASQRLEWVETLFGDMDRVVVDDYEIAEGRSVRTVESVKKLSEKYSVKYIIIGADNLASLDKWYQFDSLNESIIWVIASRAGYDLHTSKLREWVRLDMDIPISSTHIRDRRDLKYIDPKIKESVKQILEGQE
ncbi:MAG: nicotinate (nicotinamide) nucleotide adenylyltransferase [Sulfurovum sp.]